MAQNYELLLCGMNQGADKEKEFILSLEESLLMNSFVKLTFGNYAGSESDLKNVIVKKAIIRNSEMLSFTYRYKTRDIVKNLVMNEAVTLIRQLLTDFRVGNLFTTGIDIQIEKLKSGKTVLRKSQPLQTEAPSPDHDRHKHRHIVSSGKNYLSDLGITNREGIVLKTGQDKFRQINHYIELLSPMLKELKQGEAFKVADMGSGKGYLTFALFDHLVNNLQLQAQVTGVEFRKDLVELCNRISLRNDFSGLHFVQSGIQSYALSEIDMLIALHACDTATDDAIFKGIMANAGIIVVAPCCHKQIRREIEQGKTKNDMDFVTRHGIFLEREAEMVTDSIRAMILEYYGYKVKVFEFVSDIHTPKNIMIVGEKSRHKPDRQALELKINEAMKYFGIKTHHLKALLNLP